MTDERTPDYFESSWATTMRTMLGKQVTVIVQREPKEISFTGELVMFDDEGQVALRDETGCVEWCWPNLETTEARAAHAPEHVQQHVHETDSCSTCGADPNEPCRRGCMYAARTHRGWREIPAPTKISEQVLAELEALQQRRREGRG